MAPVWISHRGYKANAVENSYEAFRDAVALGFTSLETDLRVSRDGHIVLAHDPDLKRIAGDPRRIAELTRAELQDVALPHGGRLLFLDEFIREFAGFNWVFDIKPETGERTVEAFLTWLTAQGLADWICAQARFLFWRLEHEQLFKRALPMAECYAQESECWRAGIAAILGVPRLGGLKKGRFYALPPWLGPISLYKQEIIDRFHRAGAYVTAFLPEAEYDVRQALRVGVDEILINGQILTKETS